MVTFSRLTLLVFLFCNVLISSQKVLASETVPPFLGGGEITFASEGTYTVSVGDVFGVDVDASSTNGHFKCAKSYNPFPPPHPHSNHNFAFYSSLADDFTIDPDNCCFEWLYIFDLPTPPGAEARAVFNVGTICVQDTNGDTEPDTFNFTFESWIQTESGQKTPDEKFGGKGQLWFPPIG